MNRESHRERERKKEYSLIKRGTSLAPIKYPEIYIIEEYRCQEREKDRETCTDVTRRELFRSKTAVSDGIRIRNRGMFLEYRRARTENYSSPPFFFFSRFSSRQTSIAYLGAGNLGWIGKERREKVGRKKKKKGGR